MKSTGLFGKNRGRVGGVVYSNFRGEQIVRTYQPKVANPNTIGQIAQRAKFKLVSQVGASLSKQIDLSFIPAVNNQSPRNAWLSKMLKKAVYSSMNKEATLPIDDIVLTNSTTNGFMIVQYDNQSVQGALTSGWSEQAKVRMVRIAYNSGGELVVLDEQEVGVTSTTTQGVTQVGFESEPWLDLSSQYRTTRILVFAYEPKNVTGVSYGDYSINEDKATLEDMRSFYQRNIRFSETFNLVVPSNV